MDVQAMLGFKSRCQDTYLLSSTANGSTVSPASASRAGEHQPILRLPCMRFDALPPALASPAPPLPAIADIPPAHIVIILADSGTLV